MYARTGLGSCAVSNRKSPRCAKASGSRIARAEHFRVSTASLRDDQFAPAKSGELSEVQEGIRNSFSKGARTRKEGGWETVRHTLFPYFCNFALFPDFVSFVPFVNCAAFGPAYSSLCVRRTTTVARILGNSRCRPAQNSNNATLWRQSTHPPLQVSPRGHALPFCQQLAWPATTSGQQPVSPSLSCRPPFLACPMFCSRSFPRCTIREIQVRYSGTA